MYSIHLDNLEFFAHHGLHDEERITGTQFKVSLQVDLQNNNPIEHLDETVDYSKIYQIVQSHMQRPEALLEKLASNLAAEIYDSCNGIKKINIRINKIQPPISNFTGQVGVSFDKQY